MSSVVSSALPPSSRRAASYFGAHHPLARRVGAVCFQRHQRTGRVIVGGVGCGSCWESVIRDDEKVVVEFGLPRELIDDPHYIDSVAVERFLRGERVFVTDAEKAAAIHRLAQLGKSSHTIAHRLRIGHETVLRVLGGADEAVAA